MKIWGKNGAVPGFLFEKDVFRRRARKSIGKRQLLGHARMCVSVLFLCMMTHTFVPDR